MNGKSSFDERNTPLYGRLREYLAGDVYPFHMPGHKRNPKFLPPDLYSLDITEIEGMDNLHKPEGIIKELQEKISRLYGSEESYLLVNGSSSGIVAAICAASGENSALYTSRSAHQSIFHGITLSGARPVYSLDEEADAAVITCPDYSGAVTDVRGMAEEVHARGGILIVDEAHGAHFPFHEIFPETALAQGADIVVNSFHKTLPAFSQTAVLHVQGSRVDRSRLRYFLRVMQTSSPSYMFMAAADFMLEKITAEQWHFESYAENLLRLRNSLPGEDEKAAAALISSPRTDIGKLNFALRTDTDGFTISKLLTGKYKIQMEMATENYLLAMTSVADTPEGFKRLEYAVDDLNKHLPFIEPGESDKIQTYKYEIPKPVLTPAEAARRKTEIIPAKKSAGRIAADFYTEYPPGIPFLIPGERISRETAERMKEENVKVIT